MIFVDINVLYSFLVKTKFSQAARRILLMQSDLATSATVLSELVFLSLRKICKERYGTNNYLEFRRFIALKGYSPFKKDLDQIFKLVSGSDILLLPTNDDLDDWRNAMNRYNLMPNDAMIASTCFKHEITEIATFGNYFLRVDQLKVINLNE